MSRSIPRHRENTAWIRLFLGVILVLGCRVVAGQSSGFPDARSIEAGQLLVAAESLVDPNFSQTVILVVSYGGSGATGLIVNRPTGMVLSSLLPDTEGTWLGGDSLFFGGPVLTNALTLVIRYGEQLPLARPLGHDLHFSSNPELFKQLLGDPKEGLDLRLLLGSAGWAPGQLEAEMSRGDWFVSEADPATLFNTEPKKLWPQLIRRSTMQWAAASTRELPSGMVHR